MFLEKLKEIPTEGDIKASLEDMYSNRDLTVDNRKALIQALSEISRRDPVGVLAALIRNEVMRAPEVTVPFRQLAQEPNKLRAPVIVQLRQLFSAYGIQREGLPESLLEDKWMTLKLGVVCALQHPLSEEKIKKAKVSARHLFSNYYIFDDQTCLAFSPEVAPKIAIERMTDKYESQDPPTKYIPLLGRTDSSYFQTRGRSVRYTWMMKGNVYAALSPMHVEFACLAFDATEALHLPEVDDFDVLIEREERRLKEEDGISENLRVRAMSNVKAKLAENKSRRLSEIRAIVEDQISKDPSLSLIVECRKEVETLKESRSLLIGRIASAKAIIDRLNVDISKTAHHPTRKALREELELTKNNLSSLKISLSDVRSRISSIDARRKGLETSHEDFKKALYDIYRKA